MREKVTSLEINFWCILGNSIDVKSHHFYWLYSQKGLKSFWLTKFRINSHKETQNDLRGKQKQDFPDNITYQLQLINMLFFQDEKKAYRSLCLFSKTTSEFIKYLLVITRT